MFKLLALIALLIGFVLAVVDPSKEFVMAPLEWFVFGIGLALLDGLGPKTATKV